MPQVFHVLRCVECRTFQVQIVKKVPKWMCKICQKKQSVLQEFARGSGKECRLVVQRLNKQRLEQDLLRTTAVATVSDDNHEPLLELETTGSKWNKYLDEKEESSEEDLDMGFNDVGFNDVGFKDEGLARKRKCKQQTMVSMKKPAWTEVEPQSTTDWAGNPLRQNVNVDQPKNRLVGEGHSKQAVTTNKASKWTKYLDPTVEDNSSTEEANEADCMSGNYKEHEEEEEDLDKLLMF